MLFQPEGPRDKISLANSLRSSKTSLARSPSHLWEISGRGKLNKALQVGTSKRLKFTIFKRSFPDLLR